MAATLSHVCARRKAMMRTFVLPLLLIAGTLMAESKATNAQLSPAEQAMATAQRLVDKNPKNFEAYNALALALSRRARETSDVHFYTMAQDALAKSFAISPDNFDGKRIETWLSLGKHEFATAREQAIELNKKMPDDVMVYGFLTDANVELGNYSEAERAAQMMLDLRAANLPALTRAAYLRELFGDVDGALDLMNMAYQSTPPGERENGAWILTQMAHLQLSRGGITESEQLSLHALAMFPGYHYALGALAKTRIQQHRYSDAVVLLQQRYQAAPHAENLFELAQALQLAGRLDEAQQAFTEFEQKSLLESARPDNSNHELVSYYVDYAHNPEKALAVAVREYAHRHDVFTLDCYAWALHATGQERMAREQIEAALAVGIRDSRLLYHAGEIANANGDQVAARKYLNQSSELNSSASEDARTALAHLSGEIAKGTN
jgi:tetratricopeptide (TPR) repeat protein